MSLVCPRCGSDKILSLAPHARDGIRHVLLHTSLRCRSCSHCFRVFNPVKPLLLLASVIVLAGLAAWLASDRRGALPPATTPDQLPSPLAGQGDPDAQLQMGIRYAEGDGVARNDTEAARRFAMAARQGLAEAQYRYGLALLRGRGVAQDYKAAFHWIEKSALRGHARAQYSLGELYRYGTGTAMDKARAYLWFDLAAAQGMDAAAKARDSLVWQLKPEQIAAMQAEARKLRRAPGMPAPAGSLPPAAP